MTRRPLYRYRLRFTLWTLFAVTATVPLVVFAGRWLATFPLAGLGSLAIGLSVAVAVYRLLDPEETRTLYLQILIAFLIGIYAFWIPAGFLYYALGVGVGLILTWQGPEILTLLCALYGIVQVKVYENPHWRPARRESPWSDSSIVR